MTFKLGECVFTRRAALLMEQQNINPIDLLLRHVHGDDGDLSEGDKALNASAIANGNDRVSPFASPHAPSASPAGAEPSMLLSVSPRPEESDASGLDHGRVSGPFITPGDEQAGLAIPVMVFSVASMFTAPVNPPFCTVPARLHLPSARPIAVVASVVVMGPVTGH